MRFELRETDDGSLTVFDREAGECFKSRHAAKLEAEHVFYRPAVIEGPFRDESGFTVVELGLGLGTNFLHFRDRGFRGRFLTVERDLAGARFFLEHAPEPALAALVNEGSWQNGSLRAELRVGDFFDVLRSLAREGVRAHAVLFDPFSPKANPDAWTEELFRLAFALLVPRGRLVTYSVSRAAKDAASRAGFTVEKRDLPPELRKRSALLAVRGPSG